MAKGSPTPNRWGNRGAPSIEAKQRFGRAVDLYCAGNYGEALVIFNALRKEFPDSSEIEKARQQCLEARNREPLNLPGPASGQVMGDDLDDATFRAMRRIVIEKMLHGSTDTVQLQAAELVARMGGMLDGHQPSESDPAAPTATETNTTAPAYRHEAEEDPIESAHGNGHSSPSQDEDSLEVDTDEVAR